MGIPSRVLIAKNAKACDSTKSPSISYFSIGSNCNSKKFFFILSNKYEFFLPPPHTNHLLVEVLFFSLKYLMASDKSLAVKLVIVAAPFSNERPLQKRYQNFLHLKIFHNFDFEKNFLGPDLKLIYRFFHFRKLIH